MEEQEIGERKGGKKRGRELVQDAPEQNYFTFPELSQIKLQRKLKSNFKHS